MAVKGRSRQLALVQPLLLLVSCMMHPASAAADDACVRPLHQEEWHGILSWVLECLVNVSLLAIAVSYFREEARVLSLLHHPPPDVMAEPVFDGTRAVPILAPPTPPPAYLSSQQAAGRPEPAVTMRPRRVAYEARLGPTPPATPVLSRVAARLEAAEALNPMADEELRALAEAAIAAGRRPSSPPLLPAAVGSPIGSTPPVAGASGSGTAQASPASPIPSRSPSPILR